MKQETTQEESIFEGVEVDMKRYQKHIKRAHILTDDFADTIAIGLQISLAVIFAVLALLTHYRPYAASATPKRPQK